MKIVQIIPSIEFGGAEIMCENLATALSELGHEVCVVSLYDIQNEITDRLSKVVPIKFMNKKGGFDFKLIGKLRHFFQEFKPDVIHSHLYAIKYAYFASVGMKVKRIHTLHSIAWEESSGMNRRINHVLYKLKRVLPVALSGEVHKTVVDTYHMNDKQVEVVFNGVPLNKCILKNDYAFGSSINIINVARFNAVKNHITMIDAIAKARNTYPQLHMTFVGSGPLMQEAKEHVKDLALEDCFTFYGSSDNVFPLLNKADIFLLASVYEGIPMSIIEAMGTGLPVVASNVGGIPDMIKDGRSGLLCEPNADSISEALCRMIENDTLREACGKQAVLTANAYFSAIGMAEKYLELYR